MRRIGYQLRLSAVSGIQSALVIVFVTMVMIPVRAIINRTFARNVDVDWKASLIAGCSIALLWYVGICVVTFVDLRRATVRGHELLQSFPASALVAGIYGIAVLISAVLATGLYRERDPLWMQTIPAGLILIAYYGWPRTIHCDVQGIWQRTRLGLKQYIPYTAVIAIASCNGTTTVTGESASIEHTQYHAATQQFLSLLAKRTGKEIY